MTTRRPFLRRALQLGQIFLTEARIFIDFLGELKRVLENHDPPKFLSEKI